MTYTKRKTRVSNQYTDKGQTFYMVKGVGVVYASGGGVYKLIPGKTSIIEDILGSAESCR